MGLRRNVICRRCFDVEETLLKPCGTSRSPRLFLDVATTICATQEASATEGVFLSPFDTSDDVRSVVEIFSLLFLCIYCALDHSMRCREIVTDASFTQLANKTKRAAPESKQKHGLDADQSQPPASGGQTQHRLDGVDRQRGSREAPWKECPLPTFNAI